MNKPSEPQTSSPKSNRAILIGSALLVLLVLGYLAVSSGGSSDETAIATVGPTTPAESIYDFPLAQPDGQASSLAHYEGQPMVVNYFAAWCPPCRRELPDFEAVHQALGDQVAIVGVSRDSTTNEWLGLVSSAGLTFDTFFEGNTVGSYEFVGGLAMPTTAFVDENGEIKHTFSGALTEEALTELIQEHLLTN